MAGDAMQDLRELPVSSGTDRTPDRLRTKKRRRNGVAAGYDSSSLVSSASPAVAWRAMVRPKSEHARQFGGRVRERRLALGWSQERLAETVGLHWTYVGSVERGERNVSLLNICRLAAALGLDPADLVRGIRVEPR
jgi:ribosome-binding protein aMBF1 (putative translation factor)